MLEDIQEEDEDISSTSLLSGSEEGQEVDLNALVGEVKDQDLSLVVNGETFKVKTSVVGLLKKKERQGSTIYIYICLSVAYFFVFSVIGVYMCVCICVYYRTKGEDELHSKGFGEASDLLHDRATATRVSWNEDELGRLPEHNEEPVRTFGRRKQKSPDRNDEVRSRHASSFGSLQ